MIGTYSYGGNTPEDEELQDSGTDTSTRKPKPLRTEVPLREATGNSLPLWPGERPLDPTAPNQAVRGGPVFEDRGERPPPRNMPVASDDGDAPFRLPEDRLDPPAPPYNPLDTNRDGIVDEIERWMAAQNQSPAERKQDWIEQNVWAKGYTVDMATGEIVDPNTGQAVGLLPQFE